MRALVLSGGGGFGAYQVGALQHILGELKIQYDIVVGTSVGAINGLSIAMYQKGDEVLAAADLLQQWLDLKTSDIVEPRWLQPLSLLWSPSTHSVEPLRQLLLERFNCPLSKWFSCVAVDIVTGDTHRWTNANTREEIVEGVISSSMTPIIHPSNNIDGKVFYDGGLVDVSPSRLAIDLGATEIDIILTQSPKVPLWDPNPDRLWNTAPRVFTLMFRELVKGDIHFIQLYNALAEARDLARALGDDPRAAALNHQLDQLEINIEDKRVVKVRLLYPSEPLPMDPSMFEADEIRAVIDIGLEDARKVDWGI